MKVCLNCQSVSFDDQEICFACLRSFEQEQAVESVERQIESIISNISEQSTVVETVKPDVLEAITISERSIKSVHAGVPGMARLQIRMPGGYHYDVYLEKPEGASIQIGWVPEAVSEQTQ